MYKGVGVRFANFISFLAHLSRSDKVSFCDRPVSVGGVRRRPLTIDFSS